MRELKLIHEAMDLLQSLFEVAVEDMDQTSADQVDNTPNPNKVKKIKKDKNGKEVATVSVEDELFPNDGNAKQQFNKKVIDKINQMIEGTATLEDLLQLVGQKQAIKRQAVKTNESVEEFGELVNVIEQMINEVSIGLFKAAVKSSAPKRREAVQVARADKSIPYEERMKLHKRAAEAGDAVIGTIGYEETDKTPAREVIKKAVEKLPELKKKREENPRDLNNLSNYVEAKKLAKFDSIKKDNK